VAVSSSHARKIVVPFGKCNIIVPGASRFTIKELVAMTVETVSEMLEEAHG